MTNEKKAFGKPGEVRRVEGLLFLIRRYNGTQERISNRFKKRHFSVSGLYLLLHLSRASLALQAILDDRAVSQLIC